MKTEPELPLTAAEVFNRALEIGDLWQREAYVAKVCAGKEALRQEVERLLAHHKADSFMERPAGQYTIKFATNVPREEVPELPVTLKYFGDYELLEEIARGGMGVVWKARQKSLNRLVAVKMILSGQLATAADVKRFRTEAEAAANLLHPNIVAIHEIGEQTGRHYFSMDYVAGRDLAQVLKEKPLSPAEAAKLLQTIAEAVHYAHQRGTLHRDLKPHNILIDESGAPRITDFGLAKQLTNQSEQTQSGTVMGSPSYMPPEQALGRLGELGPASDVYSLGAILYQMLTGRVPFQGATAVETLQQVVEQEPEAPTKLNPAIPPDLETICLKCLEKKPVQRYASARALAEELGRFLNHEPILAKPATTARKAWNWMQNNPWALSAVSGILLLIAVMIAFGSWERARYFAAQLESTRQMQSGPMTDQAWAARKAAATRSFQPPKESPASIFLMALPVVCLFLYIADKIFKSHYKGHLQDGARLAGWQLLAQGGSGAIAVVLGIGYLLLQFRSWIWLPVQEGMVVLEAMGVLGALGLATLGFPMVWRAVGAHETSRFRGAIDQKLERELALEGQRWSVMQVLLFTPWLLMTAQGVVFLLGSMAASRGWEMLFGFGGLFLAVGAKMVTRRAVEQNQRVLTKAWLPVAGALLGFSLGAYFINSSAAFLAAASTAWLCAAIVIRAVYFRRKHPMANASTRGAWRDFLIALGTLVLLFGVLRVTEATRGRQVWNQTKAELKGKGETLDWNVVIGTKIPDEQNIMAHPYMRKHFIGKSRTLPIEHPVLEGPVQPSPLPWSALAALPREETAVPSSTNRVTSLRGILEWYGRYANDFSEIEAALQRPQTQFWGDPDAPFTWQIANAGAFGKTGQAYANICKVQLLMGDSAAALRTLQTLRDLAFAAGGSRPVTLYSAGVKLHAFRLLTNTIEETVASGKWSLEQFQTVERLCLGSGLIADGFAGIRSGERPAALRYFDKATVFGDATPNFLVRALLPTGWMDRNRANYAHLMQLNLVVWDPTAERLDSRLVSANQEAILSQLAELPALDRHMADIMMPNFSKGITVAAKTQTTLNLAATACVLERYHKAKGAYPETLDELVPEFAIKLPHDLFDGQPLRYRRTDDGRYLLYSIGWNAKDDGGIPGTDTRRKPFTIDADALDWVWQGVPKNLQN